MTTSPWTFADGNTQKSFPSFSSAVWSLQASVTVTQMSWLLLNAVLCDSGAWERPRVSSTLTTDPISHSSIIQHQKTPEDTLCNEQSRRKTLY